ncbi:MAG: MltA domain-containing protein [Bdellovibrionales bacterium]
MINPRMDVRATVFGLLACSMTFNLACGNTHATPNSPLSPAQAQKSNGTPTKKIPLTEWPKLTDDLDFGDLKTAISRQLERFHNKDLSGEIVLGGEAYPMTLMKTSLESFLSLTEAARVCLQQASTPEERANCYNTFQARVQQAFELFAPDLQPGDPRHGESKNAFFTAYYTPLIEGSTTKTASFPYAIYKRPTDEVLRQSSRQEIDFQGRFNNKNLELAYAANLYDLYLLQVQGGGKIVVQNDGQTNSYYISYHGGNGKAFTFISKYMISKGYIRDGSIASQRNFLTNNSQLHEEIYSTCPNYIYFQVTDHPPLGSDNVPLTDNRSIATDSGLYPNKGLLSFVQTQRPNPQGSGYIPFSRFMIDQDTGGAIKGKARADLYFGEGAYAERTAYSTQHRGDIFFLILKK